MKALWRERLDMKFVKNAFCGSQWTDPQLSIMIIYNSTQSILIQILVD